MTREVPLRRRTVAALCFLGAAVLILAAVLSVDGCSVGTTASPSPEALFSRVQELNAAGRTGDIWALLHPEGKQIQIDAIDQHREFLRRNPGEENVELLMNQFHCGPEEFFRLDYRDLYVRENSGRERWLEGCTTTRNMTDPNKPTDVLVWWGPPSGESFVMRTRYVPGEGYYLISLRE